MSKVERELALWVSLLVVLSILFFLTLPIWVFHQFKLYENPLLPIVRERVDVVEVGRVEQSDYYFGKASWYGQDYCEKHNLSCRMANGERFDENAFTAACPLHWQLGQQLEVTHKDKSIVVECTDRGGFEKIYGRITDLSKASFAALAPTSQGIIKVKIKEI